MVSSKVRQCLKTICKIILQLKTKEMGHKTERILSIAQFPPYMLAQIPLDLHMSKQQLLVKETSWQVKSLRCLWQRTVQNGK